jgi:hypothetical protein
VPAVASAADAPTPATSNPASAKTFAACSLSRAITCLSFAAPGWTPQTRTPSRAGAPHTQSPSRLTFLRPDENARDQSPVLPIPRAGIRVKRRPIIPGANRFACRAGEIHSAAGFGGSGITRLGQIAVELGGRFSSEARSRERLLGSPPDLYETLAEIPEEEWARRRESLGDSE